MRLAIACCVVLAAACTSRTLAGPGDGGVDLSRVDLAQRDMPEIFDLPFVLTDLAGPGVDLGGSGDQPCAAILTCSVTCTTPSCLQACVAQGTPTAQSEYQALIDCAYAQCTSSSGMCSSEDDTSMACESCIVNAATGAACEMVIDVCLNG